MSNEIFDRFTKNAQTVLSEAQKIADQEGQSISTEHILLSIVKIPGTLSHDILREYSVTYDQISLVMSLKVSNKLPRKGSTMSLNAREAIKSAFRIAADFNHFNIDCEHILIALLSDSSFGSYQLIEKVGIDPLQIKEQLVSIFNDLAEMDSMIKKHGSTEGRSNPLSDSAPIIDEQQLKEDVQGAFLSQPQTFSKTATKSSRLLEYFATNLIDRCKSGKIDPVIGREVEITRAIQILLRRSKNNPVFVGEPGVGKTAIVEGLAQKICNGQVPTKLLNKKIYQLDMGLLVAGTMYRGQFEDRLKKILAEIKDDSNMIIFIDELHSIVGTGSAEGSMDAANLLKPALSRGEIRLIGATTSEEYRKYIEKDAALERRLQAIKVNEPSTDETILILEGVKSVYEKHHGLKIEKDAIEAAALLSQKYINDHYLPDKAIDLIDEAASAKILTTQKSDSQNQIEILRGKIEELTMKKERLIAQEKFEEAAKARDEELNLRKIASSVVSKGGVTNSKITIGKEDIARLVGQITGIPIGELAEEESNKYLKLEDELSKHIISQKEAIREISRALRRNRSGLSSQKKPIGSFIFMGPSGVGKTEVARVLARYIYGKEEALVKIDMSEFMERHNLARLTGAPPGYVGYEDAGKLTEAVIKNPYSIILFDEIEKAHPDVFNILLQIMDEGRLTDAKGRIVDFKNTIIILTSNIGIEQYRKLTRIGFTTEEEMPNPEKLKEVMSKKLFDVFRAELINRLDKIIVFEPLNKDDLKGIARLQLEELEQRLKERGLKMSYTDRVIKELVRDDYDISFGARPLKRAMEEKIEGLISDNILSGELKKKNKFLLDFKNGKYHIT